MDRNLLGLVYHFIIKISAFPFRSYRIQDFQSFYYVCKVGGKPQRTKILFDGNTKKQVGKKFFFFIP